MSKRLKNSFVHRRGNANRGVFNRSTLIKKFQTSSVFLEHDLERCFIMRTVNDVKLSLSNFSHSDLRERCYPKLRNEYPITFDVRCDGLPVFLNRQSGDVNVFFIRNDLTLGNIMRLEYLTNETLIVQSFQNKRNHFCSEFHPLLCIAT